MTIACCQLGFILLTLTIGSVTGYSLFRHHSYNIIRQSSYKGLARKLRLSSTNDNNNNNNSVDSSNKLSYPISTSLLPLLNLAEEIKSSSNVGFRRLADSLVTKFVSSFSRRYDIAIEQLSFPLLSFPLSTLEIPASSYIQSALKTSIHHQLQKIGKNPSFVIFYRDNVTTLEALKFPFLFPVEAIGSEIQLLEKNDYHDVDHNEFEEYGNAGNLKNRKSKRELLKLRPSVIELASMTESQDKKSKINVSSPENNMQDTNKEKLFLGNSDKLGRKEGKKTFRFGLSKVMDSLGNFLSKRGRMGHTSTDGEMSSVSLASENDHNTTRANVSVNVNANVNVTLPPLSSSPSTLPPVSLLELKKLKIGLKLETRKWRREASKAMGTVTSGLNAMKGYVDDLDKELARADDYSLPSTISSSSTVVATGGAGGGAKWCNAIKTLESAASFNAGLLTFPSLKTPAECPNYALLIHSCISLSLATYNLKLDSNRPPAATLIASSTINLVNAAIEANKLNFVKPLPSMQEVDAIWEMEKEEGKKKAFALATAAMGSDGYSKDLRIESSASDRACCILTYSPHTRVASLAFRGTKDPIDVLTDLSFLSSRFSHRKEGIGGGGGRGRDKGGVKDNDNNDDNNNDNDSDAVKEQENPSDTQDIMEVHSGFLMAFESLRPALNSFLDSLPKNTKLLFAGHSMGGALAQIAAAYYSERNTDDTATNSMLPPPPPPTLVTFAAPSIGNEAFCDFVNQNVYPHGGIRIWNDDDVVPYVPLLIGYGHAGIPVKLRVSQSTKTYLLKHDPNTIMLPAIISHTTFHIGSTIYVFPVLGREVGREGGREGGDKGGKGEEMEDREDDEEDVALFESLREESLQYRERERQQAQEKQREIEIERERQRQKEGAEGNSTTDDAKVDAVGAGNQVMKEDSKRKSDTNNNTAQEDDALPETTFQPVFTVTIPSGYTEQDLFHGLLAGDDYYSQFSTKK